MPSPEVDRQGTDTLNQRLPNTNIRPPFVGFENTNLTSVSPVPIGSVRSIPFPAITCIRHFPRAADAPSIYPAASAHVISDASGALMPGRDRDRVRASRARQRQPATFDANRSGVRRFGRPGVPFQHEATSIVHGPVRPDHPQASQAPSRRSCSCAHRYCSFTSTAATLAQASMASSVSTPQHGEWPGRRTC